MTERSFGKFRASCACCPATDQGRRQFLAGGLATLGAGLAPSFAALAQTPAPKARRIDVHHHFSPPAWIAAVKGRDLLNPLNLSWTTERSIEDMDKGDVAASIITVTNPGLWFGDKEATRRLSRDCNEFGAKLVQQHPTRFGLFCALPLPDVAATLKEIEYSFDTLKCDGAHFMTSYGETWLGDPVYEPVIAELNRRKAVVHVHPTAANCCSNLIKGMSAGIMEYGADTTRAIMALMWSGQAAKYQDIRWIWSHAGGTAPFLAGRIDRSSRSLKDKMPQGAMHEMKKFYYDTAGAANPGAIASLIQLVSSANIMFGTDFPPGGTSAEVARELAALKLGFTDADMRAINRDNAVRVVPRLAAS